MYFFFDGLNSIPYAVCLLAAFFLGNTITTSKPTHNVYEISNQISNSGSSVIFSDNSLASIVKQAIDELEEHQQNIKLKICLDGKFDGFLSYEKILKNGQEIDQKLSKIPYFDIDPLNDVATIMYTSGTTGLPKGAMTTHHSLVSAALFCLKLKFLTENGGLSLHYPFGHVSGMFFYQICLVQGCLMVLIDVPTLDIVLAACQKYRIPTLCILPTMGEALLSGEYDNYSLSYVTEMIFGGTSIKGNIVKALIKKYNLNKFREVFGMTECLIPVIHDVNDKWISGSVGRVSPHIQMKIVDLQTGQSLPCYKSGEICFRGPLVFKGYLKNEEATSNTIGENGWLHTGDVGRYNRDGYLFITDRIKEMIKFRQFSIFPAEVEACLLEYEKIVEAVVVGVKHETDGEWIRAYVKVKEGKRVNENDIYQYMKERMADQKQLRAGIVFMDSSMPRTVIGKVDRQHFKKLIEDEIINA